MKCWSCGAELDDPPLGKLPFREVCDKCGAYLHCCVNCRHYKPGLPNDCKVPGTEPISDRERFNLCEEFSLLGAAPKKGPSVDAVKKRLFGED